ncbi:integrase family protein [Hymenobacter roseosalivarius DSM 11622]|uniref:Integrase family protein n=1 Tax=Hymenobacter roseosalivarius DSM 11622 TaxID=645990 RepID=A0A1W1VGB7_9BACT|nr:tyrosine-type recombinase/integrase [Hymenobacter roseosalivarius]SMB92004.1 integrase family protein [Hymenobacter roseosalivarius DSM 11622]
MASLKFYLDKALKTRATRTVYLRYKVPAGTLTFFPVPLVETTEAKWDQKAQRIKGTSLEVLKVNGRLQELRKEVEAEVLRLRTAANRDPLPSELRTTLPHLISKAPLATLPVQPPTGGPAGGGWTGSDSVHTLSLPQLVFYVTRLRSSELTELSAREYLTMGRCLERFRPATDPGWLLSRLTPLRLEEWRQWLVTPREQGGLDVSNVTANHRCTLLHSVLNYARDHGFRTLLTEDHLKVMAKRFKQHKAQRESLSAAELVAFYQAPLPADVSGVEMLVRDLYCLSWCTSLRQADLVSLEISNIVYDVDAAGQAVPCGLDVTSIKSLHTTMLPLNPLAVEIVQRWLNRTRPELDHRPRWGRALRSYAWPENRLFPRVTKYRQQVIRELWSRLNLFQEPVEVIRLSGGRQQRSLVPRCELLTLHTARHGFGNHMAASNVPIEDASLLMGHSSLTTTAIYYHRPATQALSRARQALQHLPGLKSTNEPD